MCAPHNYCYCVIYALATAKYPKSRERALTKPSLKYVSSWEWGGVTKLLFPANILLTGGISLVVY
jgi:hypothetical protein